MGKKSKCYELQPRGFMKNFVSFDLETTGTLSHLDDIVEIGAVRFKNGKAEESFSRLVSIEGSIPEQASKVNGITDEMLKGEARIQEVLPLFFEFCGSDLMVAHNAPFDFQFLLRAVQEHRISPSSGLVFDTCQLARKSFLGLANYKLSTLCHYLKIEGNGFHRAQSDALYCGQLFVHILEKNTLSTEDWQTLAKLSGRTPLKFPEIFLEGQMALFD